MTLIGDPGEWIDLIDTFVPDILDLVISAWSELPSPASNAREDPTTDELWRQLVLNRNSVGLPFQIRTQVVELEPQVGEDQGRMDIAFIPLVPREDIYFCLECKRLNVVQSDGKIRPYASEYITHGMMRFVRGQYAKTIRHGGMLGYVLDGDVGKAMENVATNIMVRFRELGMEDPGEMQLSSVRPKQLNLKETQHTRQHSPDIFQIHHIFAAGSTGC